jgi:DNA-directed RNA polymerase subunit RPC12/RpoP
MGSSYQARCKQCGHEFQVEDGPGFCFHLLHCTKCGKAKSIAFEKLGQIHPQYLKGLPGPHRVAPPKHGAAVPENTQGQAISETTYEQKVQEIAGECHCGGRFTFKARPRCPKCLSARLEDTGRGRAFYD